MVRRLFFQRYSNAQLLGILAVFLIPIFICLWQSGVPFVPGNGGYDVSEARAAIRGVPNLLAVLTIGISLINCVLTGVVYFRKRDERILFLGAAAVLTAGGNVFVGGFDVFLVICQFISFAGLAAACLLPRSKRKQAARNRKLVILAVMVGFFLLAIRHSVIVGQLSLISSRVAGLAVMALVLSTLYYTGLKSYRNNIFNALRLNLMLGAGGMLTAIMAMGGFLGSAAVSLMLVYQLSAAIGLSILLWETAVGLPKRALSRFLRQQRLLACRQSERLGVLEREGERLEVSITNLHDALTRSGKLTGFLELVVNNASQTLGSDHVFVSLLEGQPPLFWVVAYKSSFPPRETTLEQKFMGKNYASGQFVRIDDLKEYLPRLRPEVARAGLRSMLGLPIMLDGKLIGFFEVFFRTSAAITDLQLKLAKIYVDQTIMAIRMSKLHDDSSRKSDELTLLHQVVQVVTDQPSPIMLLTRVGKMLSDFLRADAFAAFITQRNTTQPVVQAVHVQDLSTADVERLESLFSTGQLAGVKQNSTGNETLAASSSPVFFDLTLATGKTVSVLPLFFRQIFQGVLVFFWDYDRKANSYSHMEATLATIATQIAMGLDRDYLYGSIQKMGLTDTLTDIANRRFFDYTLKREFIRMRRSRQPLSLLMVDIDYFKKINDTWGHQTGDVILKEMGGLLKTQFRATDFPARYGGEEFAVILPETDSISAYALAEKLRDQAAKRIFAPSTDRVSLTLSIGVATVENGGQSENLSEADLILAADQSLYRAKHSGRNRVEVAKL